MRAKCLVVPVNNGKLTDNPPGILKVIMKKKRNYEPLTRMAKGMGDYKTYLLRVPANVYEKLVNEAHKDKVTVSVLLNTIICDQLNIKIERK